MSRYPHYRSSSIGLISEIPSHWVENTIKRGFEISLGKMLQGERKFESDFLAPYLRSANVQWGTADVSDVQEMWFSPEEALQLELVPGDLIACEGGDAGRAAIWQGEISGCFFQNSVNRVRSCGGNSTRFLMYWLSALKAGGLVEIICNKATIAHLTKEKLANLPMVYPPLDEQYAIAAYLDAETKRIDGLIGEKTSLLSMLEEYRLSAIFELLEGASSHDLERCNPGLGWLRTLPSHWAVCGLGKRYEVQLGKMLDAKQITGEHLRPYLRNQDVQWRHINVENLPVMDFDASAQQKFSLQKGDVLVCEGGEVGRAAVWNSDFECFYQKAIHRLRPLTSEDEPDFVVLLLEIAVKSGVFNIAEKSTIAHLPADQLRQHRFPFPPLSEQKQIVHESQLISCRVRELQQHVKTEIEKLKELRAATITDAVLGRLQPATLKTHT